MCTKRVRTIIGAVLMSLNWPEGSDNVVLVSGEGYADAVSASVLDKKLDAPILLTTPDTLSSDTRTALDALKPKNIYIVGGEGFSDVLSAAPAAAAKDEILLLADNDKTSTKSTIDFIKANNSKVTVIGTSNIINDDMYKTFGAAQRVDGEVYRFATNLNVLNNFKEIFKTDKLYIANASSATPDNLYADVLAASAVAGKYSAPLVLVDTEGSSATTDAIAYIRNNTADSTDLQI
ncbi:MAG: cell wall-binding repeat-containing protein [Clostridium sp.]|uniref:cell wall-binding repeat-containing protein n=1 Tax=Clostridium sp. TaxID=1506 RepID=UPI0025BC288B|nr:cell wall-binding repeat-containing protein [Clostridium sp.]MCH3963292.1 cell wall-binding repeat-containing protein [Clostridium sp.]MCI1717267.1 cell wall-binding repeat-containing protein [Clostridium sp.]MCI1801607.1 cell wall-binding repeat-containing protein [Clostridium sp.]MCI1815453.1 cell wall-binding repeat-containing protein [Clostridium sp.]MCI1872356.1 cell wall-binding repeat-containing protein [Clostridium sp.]